MAAVGAVKIGDRVGYFAIVNGRNWTKVYMEDDEESAFLKAIAEAGWEEYQDYLDRIRVLEAQRREDWFRKLLHTLPEACGLLAVPLADGGFAYSISDNEGYQDEGILCDSFQDAHSEFLSLNEIRPS